MGKPHNEVYEKFRSKYQRLNQKYDMDQYLVPYLMSSHPGCTLDEAVELAEWLNKSGRQPEQVQDFYPTPGTLSTCMYYTGIDPRTMKPVYVPKDPHEKAMQRALMQWKRPEKRRLVKEALHRTGREDLIGYGKHCLLRPDSGVGQFSGGQAGKGRGYRSEPSKPGGKPVAKRTRPETKAAAAASQPKPKKKAGWATAKPKKNSRKKR
jgi:hypothetical protein